MQDHSVRWQRRTKKTTIIISTEHTAIQCHGRRCNQAQKTPHRKMDCNLFVSLGALGVQKARACSNRVCIRAPKVGSKVDMPSPEDCRQERVRRYVLDQQGQEGGRGEKKAKRWSSLRTSLVVVRLTRTTP